MAKEVRSEQQGQESSGKDVTRPQPGGLLHRGWTRGGWYPWGLSPVELLGASPYSLFRRMTDEMNRVFGEFGFSREEETKGLWAPAIEVRERDGNILVRADLPGIQPSDVKIETSEDAIVIQGERRSETEEKKGGVQVSERRYGSFYRTIPLPAGAKGEEARAKFENGVLEITVPVEQARAKRREIPIEGGKAA